jgi:hypothetical protein
MANETLTRFVDGPDGQRRPLASSSGPPPAGPDSDKLEFWDSFAAAGDEARRKAAEPERKDFWDDFAAAGDAKMAKRAEPERKDFWDEFSAIGDAKTAEKQTSSPAKKGPSSVGTAAMRKPAGGGGAKEEWGEW